MYLITHDHQIGFKSKHSTDICIFTVKSIVKYIQGKTVLCIPVFWTLLKLSTALITGHYLGNLLIAKFHC